MDIVEFLRLRLDEDEQVARAAPGPQWDAGDGYLGVAGGRDLVWGAHTEGFVDVEASAHIARHDLARVLREVEAKRRVVQWCAAAMGSTSLGPMGEQAQLLARNALAALAQPYADHPDYREEWRP